ncbi:MAG: GH3 auxin-responsive promoter family protein [Thainema sp.]
MSWLMTTALRWQGYPLMQQLEKATQYPAIAQQQVLRQLLQRHAKTRFGREHRFDQIRTPADYRQAVPIRDYEGFRPYVQQMMAGEPDILVRESVGMFTMTSGTTGQAKYIPVTPSVEQSGSALMRQWLYRIWRNYPRFLNGGIVGVVSPAVEGYTDGGIPYGSLSGRIYQQIPPLIRRHYAVPYEVFEITDYDARYWAIARFALARVVSFLCTPNPSTLNRLARVMSQHSESLIRAIHDGTMGECLPAATQFNLVANPQRARQLERIVDATGGLKPKDCWPHLQLLGCWTGGSVGAQARQLTADYGALPTRDLGYLASEARVTIPYQDNTAGGLLDLNTNFYEFVPEAEAEQADPSILLSHELEIGQRYQILLTTPGGLYRYHINDIVEVTGRYHQSPVIAFLRKGRDMSNLTGEKLHVNHVLTAIATLQHQLNLAIIAYRLVANPTAMRYELHLELTQDASITDPDRVLSVLDQTLAQVNAEYAQKRASQRLQPPCLHWMRPGWAEAIKRQAIAQGKRDVQYKWSVLCPEPLSEDISAILQTYLMTKNPIPHAPSC